MIQRLMVGTALVAMVVLNAVPAAAQARVPSVYDSDCKGLICQSGGPRTESGAPIPPPPCQGLLCGMTPYSMERPVTAAEAQQMQAERARAEAAAAAAAAPAEKPLRKGRHAKVAKSKAKAKPVAARTPDPSMPPAAPATPQ